MATAYKLRPIVNLLGFELTSTARSQLICHFHMTEKLAKLSSCEVSGGGHGEINLLPSEA